jgi:Tfp pilus assembly protein PilZ
MLKKRFALRYELPVDCTWTSDSRTRDAGMVNISAGGCYIRGDVTGIQTGMEGTVQFQLNSHNFRFRASVVWINEAEVHEKPVGFGMQFNRRHGRTVRAIVRLYGKRVLTR